jgi:cytochrome c oxidase assembly factor 6
MFVVKSFQRLNSSFPSTAEPSQCRDLRKLYEKGCPSQWVKHFDRKRTYEQFKKRMEKGYDPLTAKDKKP